MKIIEIINRLENVKFTKEQAKTIADILEESREKQTSREHVEMVAGQAKYELVKWIVGGIIASGLVATLLKFYS